MNLDRRFNAGKELFFESRRVATTEFKRRSGDATSAGRFPSFEKLV
jgi:hypothetical protein